MNDKVNLKASETTRQQTGYNYIKSTPQVKDILVTQLL